MFADAKKFIQRDLSATQKPTHRRVIPTAKCKYNQLTLDSTSTQFTLCIGLRGLFQVSGLSTFFGKSCLQFTTLFLARTILLKPLAIADLGIYDDLNGIVPEQGQCDEILCRNSNQSICIGFFSPWATDACRCCFLSGSLSQRLKPVHL